MKETRSHGGFGHSDDLGSFDARALFELQQDERGALLERELIHGSLEQSSNLRAGRFAHSVQSDRPRLGRKALRHGTAARRGPHMVLRVVEHHGQQKSPQRRPPLEAREGRRECQEHFLDEIFREAVVADESTSETTDRDVMGVERFGESCALSEAHTIDEGIPAVVEGWKGQGRRLHSQVRSRSRKDRSKVESECDRGPEIRENFGIGLPLRSEQERTTDELRSEPPREAVADAGREPTVAHTIVR